MDGALEPTGSQAIFLSHWAVSVFLIQALFAILFTDGKIPLDKTITVTKFIQMPVWLIILTSLLSFLGIALALFFLGFNLRYRKKRLVLKAIKLTVML